MKRILTILWLLVLPGSAAGQNEKDQSLAIHVDLGNSNPFVVEIADFTLQYSRKAKDEFQKAVITYHVGDTATTVKILEDTLESTPEFYEAHQLLGTIYQRMGQFRDAEKQYNASRTLNSKQLRPLLNLATLYLQEAEASENADDVRFATGVIYDDALHVLQEADQMEPHNARVLFLLGITFYKTYNNGLAESSLNEAFSIDRDMDSVRLALANLYIRERKWKEAISQLDAYLADNPASTDRTQLEAIHDRLLQQK